MTACDHPPLIVHTEIDDALLECSDAPAIPAGVVTNRQDNAFKSDLWFAHADCKSKLARVREIVKGAS